MKSTFKAHGRDFGKTTGTRWAIDLQIVSNVGDLVYYTIGYMQMTEDQVL